MGRLAELKLGGHLFWDDRNHLIEDVNPGLQVRGQHLEAKRRYNPDRAWRNWWWGNQGQTPECTAYSMITLMAADPIRHPRKNPLAPPDSFYSEIQQIDRNEGRYYDEGGTTLAACKAALKRGWIGSYEWADTFESAIAWLHDQGPLYVGTNWYSTMYDRDASGLISIQPGATIDGGHAYCVNGIFPNLNRVRIAQTWGDGYYYLSIPDFKRLFEEDGEIALLRELPV